MSKLKLLLLSAFVASASASCLVKEESSGQQKQCRFPFIYKGVKYTECTRVDDPQDRLWCSTRTSSDGLHIGGGNFWGVCPEGGCPKEDDGISLEEVDSALSALEDNAPRSGFTSCPCLGYADCPVVARLITIGNSLPRGHSRRQRIANSLRNVICEKQGSRRERLFHCCSARRPTSDDGKDGDRPEIPKETTTAEPDNVRQTTNFAVNDTDPNLGTWKPRAEFGECGVNALGGSVVGGEIARPGEFPFMVLLGYNINGRIYYTCGGSLINRYYVLTAAHCITGPNEVKELLFGEHDMGSRGKDCDGVTCLPLPQRRFPAPDGITVHEKWDDENFEDGNDIALIRLNKPVDTFIENPANIDRTILAPICLPWDPKISARKLKPAEEVLVAGWGKITNSRTKTSQNYEDYSTASRYLNKLKLPLETEENCLKHFPRFKPKTQYCAGGIRGEDSCSGDSGGPLFYQKDVDNWYQVGVVSFGTLRCGKGKPGVYTKVSSYLDWIQRNLKP